ncbi:flippase-like domain-containing protein [Flavobacterium sp. N2270]|uniref:flippase-like domain-containing protein n=1 Tax=Flavobacterium sp. N2270 TaxID=2986831 RepID=UPI002225B5AE|nr:flippase-like domain-containing protein [Flavobacterium sp. N2270]
MIVSIALFYIYQQLQGDKKINWNVISSYLSLQSIGILLLFSTINWTLEIFKWKHLVSSFKEITFLESANQSLGSLTASIFTPNRIGEYGAKVLYFTKENSKQIVLLNFIGNSSQMLVTTFFGVIGILIIDLNFQVSNWVIFGVLIGSTLLLFLFKNVEIYGFSIQKLIQKITSFPLVFHRKNLLLSVLRYLVFSTQFYFLLLIFDISIPFEIAFGTIFSMYLLASIIPSIHLMDVAIKGSVAVYLFGLIGVESWKIIAITSLMWIFNLVLPVIIGSYFVLQFKPNKE